MRSPYADLWHRLMANSTAGDHGGACWCWMGKRDRGGYGRLNLWVPSERRVVTVQAHILTYVLLHGEARSAQDAWDEYQNLVASGLELDHTCRNPTCINVDHLEPVTPAENCRRRDEPWRIAA